MVVRILLWTIRTFNSLLGLGLLVEGVLLFFRVSHVSSKIKTPLLWVLPHLSLSYAKQLIVMGIVALVIAVCCDASEQKTGVGIWSFLWGAAGAAWIILACPMAVSIGQQMLQLMRG